MMLAIGTSLSMPESTMATGMPAAMASSTGGMSALESRAASRIPAGLRVMTLRTRSTWAAMSASVAGPW